MTRAIVTAIVQAAGLVAVLASVAVLFGGWWAVLTGGCVALALGLTAESRALE